MRHPDLQSQPTKRIEQDGPHAQNFSQKFLLFAQEHSALHGPVHVQGVYRGHGLVMSCFARLLTTCSTANPLAHTLC